MNSLFFILINYVGIYVDNVVMAWIWLKLQRDHLLLIFLHRRPRSWTWTMLNYSAFHSWCWYIYWNLNFLYTIVLNKIKLTWLYFQCIHLFVILFWCLLLQYPYIIRWHKSNRIAISIDSIEGHFCRKNQVLLVMTLIQRCHLYSSKFLNY